MLRVASPVPFKKSPKLSTNRLVAFAKVSNSIPPISDANFKVCKSLTAIPKTPDILPRRSVAIKEFLINNPKPAIPTAPVKAVLKLNTALVKPLRPRPI